MAAARSTHPLVNGSIELFRRGALGQSSERRADCKRIGAAIKRPLYPAPTALEALRPLVPDRHGRSGPCQELLPHWTLANG